MSTPIFNDFIKTTPAAWKNKIQVDLKGADYNDTLLWKTQEGIVVKPFYTKEDQTPLKIEYSKKPFNICETIFVDDEKIANSLAIDALNKSVNSIQFIANKTFDYKKLLLNIDVKSIFIYFQFHFLDDTFQIELSKFINSERTYFQTDIIGNIAESGNWFFNLKEDFIKLERIVKNTTNSIGVSGDLYQNCGATITQQLAYTLAHANEYLNKFGGKVAKKISFSFSIGSNYFFEIAKLKAFKILWSTLIEEYEIVDIEAHLFVQPSLRNKTIYDHHVNLLRTTSECMSAILGGSNTISNVPYDAIHRKSNEFGKRISRNQLLILKQEDSFLEAENITEGSYYIESITQQLAENALTLFKQIEKSGGFLKQLKNGVIQRKTKESAKKEEQNFLNKEIILLGTNLYKNEKQLIHKELELYPFAKQRNIKTLVPPLTRSRLSESIEKIRLHSEKKI